VRITQTFKASRLTLALAAASFAVACGFFATAQPAAAECPTGDLDCTPGPIITHRTISNTLTVTTTQGTVTSDPAGINCGVDCTAMSSQTVACSDGDCAAPDPDGWDSYSLTATGGPSGFSPSWTGCDSVTSGVCSVKLDADTAVSLAWIDTTDPTVALSIASAGGRVGRMASVSAAAADNAGVARVQWFIGNSGTPVATDTTAPYSATIDLSALADGSQVTIGARAYDTSNRASIEKTVTVTLDKSVNLTSGSVPAFTNATAVPLTISTDSDASMQCALSGAVALPAAPCAGSFSPISAASPDGSYTYSIRATDAVGNVASTTRSFVLDRTLPALAFTEGPTEGQMVGTSAIGLSFSEVETNPDALSCSLDGSPVPCAAGSPVTIAGLTNGSHVFTVHSADKAGNERTITRNFAVSLPNSGAGSGTTGTSGSTGNAQADPLVVSLRALKQRALKKKKLVLSFTANHDFKVSGSVRLGHKMLGRFSRSVRSGKHTVSVKLSKKALAALRKALRHKKTTKLALKLTYTDANGYTTTRARSVSIRR
jgi:hypothetical protein